MTDTLIGYWMILQKYNFLSRVMDLYAEYIMRNTELEEAQDGIKITRRNINLRYADNTTLMAESKENLKRLLRKVKEESENANLKLSVQKLRS